MKIKITYGLIFFIFFGFNSLAQDEERMEIQPLSKYLIKTNFRIPFSTSNRFFKEVSNGVVDATASFNYSFVKNFYVGAGYRYSYFKLDERKLNSSPNELFNGRINKQGFYGELSYFLDLYENISMEFNFQTGQEKVTSSSINCTTEGISPKKSGLFYSPNINFYLKGEEVFSFFLSLGYTFSSNTFAPEDVCVDSFTDYSPVDYEGNYGQINIGFGIGISIIKPSK